LKELHIYIWLNILLPSTRRQILLFPEQSVIRIQRKTESLYFEGCYTNIIYFTLISDFFLQRMKYTNRLIPDQRSHFIFITSSSVYLHLRHNWKKEIFKWTFWLRSATSIAIKLYFHFEKYCLSKNIMSMLYKIIFLSYREYSVKMIQSNYKNTYLENL
jgi:hypothetical protein